VLERLALVTGRAHAGQSGRAGTAIGAVLGVLAGHFEEPGLSLFQLVHVVAVVSEKGSRSFHVAHACELQLEVEAVGLALGLELGDLAAQPLGRLGVLRGLGDLRLKGGDLLVALGDLLLVVEVLYLRLALRALILLLRRALRVLRSLLAAIDLTVHVPACLS